MTKNPVKIFLIVCALIFTLFFGTFGVKSYFNYRGCVAADYRSDFPCSVWSVSKTACQFTGQTWGQSPNIACVAAPCEKCLTEEEETLIEESKN